MPTLICRSLRNKVYTLALSKITPDSPYMCIAIQDALEIMDLRNWGEFTNKLILSFPEVMKFKPTYAIINGAAWFSSNELKKRKEILTKCIKQTS